MTLDGGTTVSGLVQGGASQDIEVGFMAKNTFPLETWYSAIEVTSNDLVNSPALVPVSMTVGCFQPWDYSLTGLVHSISIPLDVAPSIFGEPLVDMDWIGVFYIDDNGEEACGGAVQWNGVEGVVINAYGDDPTTEDKDGFAEGEAFRWRMKQCGSQDQYTANATYDAGMPNQGIFSDFGLSKLTSLDAAYKQYYTYTQGWNSVSSYIVPSNPAVEDMFAPMVNQLTILRNLSEFYWPVEGINTIGDWDNYSGYVMKVTEDVDFEISGEAYASGEITLPAGWLYLPVLSRCSADVMEMFGGNLDDVIIIQELIGTGIFWPAMEVYTLEILEPGEAYKVKLANEITVAFPECLARGYKSASANVNSIETVWGQINMTPASQIALFMSGSLKNCIEGDVIGAFDQNGNIYGYLPVSGLVQNQVIILFGGDNTSMEKDGFVNDETISFKLMRAATGEAFDLEVEYDQVLENISGNFISGSFSAISNVKMSPTGIGEQSSSNIRIYPNPADEILNIEGIDTESEVRIFNIFGEEVYSLNVNTSARINLSGIAKGSYVIRISNDQSSTYQKLIIK
nr:T9SS type A sorting domain-containing protein [Bacteroidota bacterium]